MKQIKNNKKAGFLACLLGLSPIIAVIGFMAAMIGWIWFCITTIIGDGNYSLFWICSVGLLITLIFTNIAYFGLKINKKLNSKQKYNVSLVVNTLTATTLLCYALATKSFWLILLCCIYYIGIMIYWIAPSFNGPTPWNNPWD